MKREDIVYFIKRKKKNQLCWTIIFFIQSINKIFNGWKVYLLYENEYYYQTTISYKKIKIIRYVSGTNVEQFLIVVCIHEFANTDYGKAKRNDCINDVEVCCVIGQLLGNNQNSHALSECTYYNSNPFDVFIWSLENIARIEPWNSYEIIRIRAENHIRNNGCEYGMNTYFEFGNQFDQPKNESSKKEDAITIWYDLVRNKEKDMDTKNKYNTNKIKE